MMLKSKTRNRKNKVLVGMHITDIQSVLVCVCVCVNISRASLCMDGCTHAERTVLSYYNW